MLLFRFGARASLLSGEGEVLSRVADPTTRLDMQRDYYQLDGHLSASGHARYAAAIEEELRRREVPFD